MSGEDSSSTAPGGSSPLGGGVGQLYLREGFYPRPLGGLPGGGGPLDGRNAGVNVNPVLQAKAPSSISESLKGTAPVIFDGNRKNTKQFI